MATKKPLKAAKPAAKPSQSIKKVASKKEMPAKASKTEVPKKQLSKNGSLLAKAANIAVKKAVAAPKKLSVSATKVAASNKVVPKEAVKKTQEQVKKSSVPDKKAPVKAAIPAKKVLQPEKKVAKVTPVEKPVPVVKEEAVPKVSSGKQVIVPSKPLANPKPVPEKKVEGYKSDKPVVIPKTSTDKKVDYDPDFTKSVLDAPPVAAQAPTMRYSDQELQEFRELINKKLEAAKKELAYLQGLITRRDEMGGDETDNRYMTMEDGGMSMEREQLSQMASRQITFIDHLEKAIMRIENKTYGICRVTGKLIDKARLRAVPHATLSMEAKLGIAK
jgi:RNA polymerase-binding transcription factor DksA